MSLTCPTDPELLRYALEAGGRSDSALTLHFAACASCRGRVAALQQVMVGIEASASSGIDGEGDCLDELALAELAAGQDPFHFREVRVRHLAACGRCRRELASLIELLADSDVAAELQQFEQGRNRWARNRGYLGGAGLIAAAILVVLVLPRRADQNTAPHRDPTITATAAPAPVSPIGVVVEATSLTWSRVPGADRYRVSLFDAEGQVRYETLTSDTIAALPDSIALVPGASYLWKVEARTELERWASSGLFEFRVSRTRSP